MDAKTKKILISSLLGVAIAGAAVGAGFAIAGGGSYELTDFIVNPSGVTTQYEIGDEVSLAGLTMTAKYSDASEENVELADVRIYLGETDITDDLSKITESVGEKTIKIVYTTKYGEKSKELKITVTEEEIVKPTIEAYAAPAFIARYQNSIQNATNDPTATNFESEFFKTDDTTYTVGADNAFKFLPNAYDGNMQVLTNVIVNSTVQVMYEDSYVALTKAMVEGQDYVYEYSMSDEVLLVENAAKNEFDFTAAAIGKQFKLSVLPELAVYESNVTNLRSVELEIEVVDGYNVYTANDLAVMDNSGRNEWKSLKAANGLTDVTTNGVILHNSLAVTTEHIPAEFTYTLEESYKIEYKLGETVGKPEDFNLTRTFLWDKYQTKTDQNGNYNANHINIYVRRIADGGNFNFYGNYYDLDLSALPLVASFDAGTTPTQSYVSSATSWYGTDQSNAKFLLILGNKSTWNENDENCLFKNVSVRGNSQVDQLIVTNNTTGFQKDTLVYCGGIIFVTIDGCSALTENVRAYKFFIPFFAQYNATSTYIRTKCYDSANNAFYGHNKVIVDIQKSYFQRSGGPLILVRQSDYDKANANETIAQVTIDEASVMESYVTGEEAWFQSVNATSIVGQFKGLDLVLQGMQKSMFTNGKMNVVAVMMGAEDDASAAVSAIDVQGSTTYGSTKLNRNKDTALGGTIYSVASNILATQETVAPIFNFGDNVYYYAGDYGIMTPTGTTPNCGAAAMYADANAAGVEYFTLNYGGLGVILGLFDYQTVS